MYKAGKLKDVDIKSSLEAELLEWGIEEVRNNSQIPSYEAVRQKALCIAKQLGVVTEFKASKGWISEHFNKRLKEKCGTLLNDADIKSSRKCPSLEVELLEWGIKEVRNNS